MKSIDEMIEKNKRKYDKTYEELIEINESIDKDYKSLINVGNEIPSELNDNEKTQLDNITENMQLKVKFFQNKLDEINKYVLATKEETEYFIKSYENAKGNVMLKRNTLQQNLIDQDSILNEGINTNVNLVNDLKRLVKEMKKYYEGDTNNESIKEMVKGIVDEKVKNLEESLLNKECSHKNDYCRIEDDNKLNAGQLEKINILALNLEKQLSDNIREIDYKLVELEKNLDRVKDKLTMTHEKIENLKLEFTNDMDNYKFNITRKMNDIEKTIEENAIEKF